MPAFFFVSLKEEDVSSLNLWWEKKVALYLFHLDASYGGAVLKPSAKKFFSQLPLFLEESTKQISWTEKSPILTQAFANPSCYKLPVSFEVTYQVKYLKSIIALETLPEAQRTQKLTP